MMTHDDRGEGGVKNCQNGGDVICGCPLTWSYISKNISTSSFQVLRPKDNMTRGTYLLFFLY